MHNSQEIAEMIIGILKKNGMSVNKMLQECRLGKGVIDAMKSGSMPSADKLFIIADYLNISAGYLMGVIDDPIPPKNDMTDEERLAAEIFKMSKKKREQLTQYANFLKTQEEFSRELSESLSLSPPKQVTES